MTGIWRRVGWGFLDQTLSSASNFALGAFVAATVSAVEFGSFALAYAVYGVCVGLSGGLASVPLVVRFSAADGSRFDAAARSSLGTALTVGCTSGGACVLAATV